MFPSDPRIAQASTLLVNFSGGKDSQAMLLEAIDTVDRDRILVHHQDLGEADWPETRPYVESICERLSLRLVIEKSPRGGLLDMLKQAVKNRREDLPALKDGPMRGYAGVPATSSATSPITTSAPTAPS